MSPVVQYKPESRWRRFSKAVSGVDPMDVVMWSLTLALAAACFAGAVQVIRWGFSS